MSAVSEVIKKTISRRNISIEYNNYVVQTIYKNIEYIYLLFFKK